jgi:hypothetical protein
LKVEDLFDTESFAEVFFRAATEPKEKRQAHGKVLNDFIMANDIERFGGVERVLGKRKTGIFPPLPAGAKPSSIPAGPIWSSASRR